MKNRPYQIYEGLFYKLLEKCRSHTPNHRFEFTNPLYSMDATVINLCLSLFPWAKYRQLKGAIKLHYLYDHRGSLPLFMVMTDGNQRHVWFETRAKTSMQYRIVGQHQPIDHPLVTRDDEIELIIEKTRKKYSKTFRLVCYTHPETKKVYTFITNNMKLPAATIAAIYKSRWQIELFFKWIKQNLKIKSFLGTSQNAMLSQIWVAMCYYLLLSYIKFQTKYSYSLQVLTRMIASVLMEQRLLIDILSLTERSLKKVRDPVAQLSLF
jgi:hypothetical protein